MNRDTIRNGVDDTVKRARDTADGLLSEARHRLDDGGRRVADKAEDAYGATLKSVEGAARDRPLQTVALALGIGFIAGLLAVRR